VTENADDLPAMIDDVEPQDERICHKALAAWRVRGEWFRATPECLDGPGPGRPGPGPGPTEAPVVWRSWSADACATPHGMGRA
jgi:hypothetical protein